jgi:hypothetical protein
MCRDLSIKFNELEDNFKQEAEHFLAQAIRDPNYSLFDAIAQHAVSRGLTFDLNDIGDLPQEQKDFWLTHDAVHVIKGLMDLLMLRHGVLSSERYADYQSGHHSELTVFEMQDDSSDELVTPTTMSIATGTKAPIPSVFCDVARADVSMEENYTRTLCWLIGGFSGDRFQNIRYFNGNDMNTEKGRKFFEDFLGQFGFHCELEKNDIFDVVGWSVKDNDGNLLFGQSPYIQDKLPHGSNGVQNFERFQFASEDELKLFFEIYKRIDNMLEIGARGNSNLRQFFKDIKLRDIVDGIETDIKFYREARSSQQAQGTNLTSLEAA